MLIEASPSAYKLMAARKERSRSIKIHGAIGDRVDNVTYIDIEGPQSQLSCVKEFASPAHLDRIYADMKTSGSGTRRDVVVPMKPLTDWLSSYNVSKVDFFSLDVEGAELSILKTIDFFAIEIDVITIEVNNQFDLIFAFLSGKGFSLFMQTELDVIFCRSGMPLCIGSRTTV